MDMIHERIRNRRVQKRLSQKEVADFLHKSLSSSYNRIELGRVKIEVKDLDKIAQILECNAGDFLQEKEDLFGAPQFDKVFKELNELKNILKEIQDNQFNIANKKYDSLQN